MVVCIFISTANSKSTVMRKKNQSIFSVALYDFFKEVQYFWFKVGPKVLTFRSTTRFCFRTRFTAMSTVSNIFKTRDFSDHETTDTRQKVPIHPQASPTTQQQPLPLPT